MPGGGGIIPGIMPGGGGLISGTIPIIPTVHHSTPIH